MVTMRWSAQEGWDEPQIEPLTPISMHPATMALHYGQTIFEGMKAFWRPDGQRAVFRPADHARRFNNSARRMAMPTLPVNDSSRQQRRRGSTAPGYHTPAGTVCTCGRS